MARVAFIGLGNMGGGMAANLAKAGHEVRAFDLARPALDRAVEHGCTEAASAVEAEAQAAGYTMVDAPVSGGIAAADAGTLTFMVGGSDDGFTRARDYLEKMGKTVIHAGGPGA